MEKILKKAGDGVTCPVAIILKNGSILTGHRHYTPDKFKKISAWTIPGGRSDVGETIEQSLRREVAEEVNISEMAILDFIGTTSGAKEGDEVLIFLCKTTQGAKLMEPEKFSEWKWVSIKDFIAEEKYCGFSPSVREKIVKYLSLIKGD